MAFNKNTAFYLLIFYIAKGLKNHMACFCVNNARCSVRYVKKALVCNHQYLVVVGSAIFGILWAVVEKNNFEKLVAQFTNKHLGIVANSDAFFWHVNVNVIYYSK